MVEVEVEMKFEIYSITFEAWIFFVNNIQNFSSCFTGNTLHVYYNNSG